LKQNPNSDFTPEFLRPKNACTGGKIPGPGVKSQPSLNGDITPDAD